MMREKNEIQRDWLSSVSLRDIDWLDCHRPGLAEGWQSRPDNDHSRRRRWANINAYVTHHRVVYHFLDIGSRSNGSCDQPSKAFTRGSILNLIFAMDIASTYYHVNSKYSELANQADTATDGADNSKYARIAESFGYTAAQLSSLPPGTNLGLSCGNPLATAHIQPDETMADLGSGGGFDCLIAARQMIAAAHGTPKGKIYGVDRSSDMVALARKNAERAGIPVGFVEFVEAPITHIPLPDTVADLVVNNCVINLVPDEDKPRVFKEIHRLLKPGGRLAASDILAKRPLPERIRKDVALVVGCIAGASLVDEYKAWMTAAGFAEQSLMFVETGKDLNVYKDSACCGDDVVSKENRMGEAAYQTEGNETKKCCVQTSDACGCGESHDPKTKSTAPCCRKDNAAAEQDGGCCSPLPSIDFNEWVAAYQIYAVKGA